MLKSMLYIFLLVQLVSIASRAQSETPALRVFNEWLSAFDSGDSAQLLSFWKRYGSGNPGPQVARDRGLHDMTGGFKVLNIAQNSASHIVASLKDNHGGFAEITLDLASTEPPVIKGILGHPVPPPGSERHPASNAQELAHEVEAHAADLVHSDQFSGTILISYRGRPVLIKAFGSANREKKVPNTVNTQFCIGSMNKMFTAVAVLQLAQAGKLSLDGVLANYWPDYPNHELATRTKIRQLLDHTAGTGDIFTPEYEARRLQIHTPNDYVTLFGKRPLRFEPGSKFEYSNYGYILLGRLVELISGQDYQSYVRDHIYSPARMTHTDSRPQADARPSRAIGYTHASGALQPNTATLPWSGTSAGGGYSTVQDLEQFAAALHSGKLLDLKLVREATTDQSGTGYGFGFSVFPDGGFGHGGGAPGINGELRIYPNDYVVAVLANLDPPSATAVANIIESRLPAH